LCGGRRNDSKCLLRKAAAAGQRVVTWC